MVLRLLTAHVIEAEEKYKESLPKINKLLNRSLKLKIRKTKKIRDNKRKSEKMYRNIIVIAFAKLCI